jgi:hypothetical protein
MKEFLLVAESSSGRTIKEAWVPGATLEVARQAFWNSLDEDEKNATASVEDVEVREAQ